MLGYQVAVPGQHKLLNALRWDRKVDPVAWQPGSTIFERAVEAGIAACRVAPARFPRRPGCRSPPCAARTTGPADSLGALVAQAAVALKESDRALVMTYYGKLDSTGHVAAAARRTPGVTSSGMSTSSPSSSPRPCRMARCCT